MTKLQVKTDGNLIGSSVYDELGNCVGKILEVTFVETKPLTIVKIGDDNYRPTPADLEKWREIFETAESKGDSKIFTHSAVNVELIYHNGPVKVEAKI